MKQDNENKNAQWSELLRNLRYLHLGVIMAVSIVGTGLLGHWLDGKIGTDPVLLIVGVVLGVVAGGYACYRILWREFGNGKRNEK